MTTNPPVSPEHGATPVAAETNPRKRPLWLWIALAVVAAIVLVLLLSRCGGDDSKDAAAGGTASATNSATGSSATSTPAGSSAAATTSAADASTPATPATSAASGGAAGGAGAGTLTANGTALLPLATAAGPGGDLSKYVGQPVIATAVVVQSAPADNGFWIGTSVSDQIWVQLLQPGLVSPHPVRAGDHVTFTGTMVANPEGFAAQTALLNAAQGADQLTAQKAHVEAAKTSITFPSG